MTWISIICLSLGITLIGMGCMLYWHETTKLYRRVYNED